MQHSCKLAGIQCLAQGHFSRAHNCSYRSNLPGEGLCSSHFKVPGRDLGSPVAARQLGLRKSADSQYSLQVLPVKALDFQYQVDCFPLTQSQRHLLLMKLLQQRLLLSPLHLQHFLLLFFQQKPRLWATAGLRRPCLQSCTTGTGNLSSRSQLGLVQLVWHLCLAGLWPLLPQPERKKNVDIGNNVFIFIKCIKTFYNFSLKKMK